MAKFGKTSWKDRVKKKISISHKVKEKGNILNAIKQSNTGLVTSYS